MSLKLGCLSQSPPLLILRDAWLPLEEPWLLHLEAAPSRGPLAWARGARHRPGTAAPDLHPAFPDRRRPLCRAPAGPASLPISTVPLCSTHSGDFEVFLPHKIFYYSKFFSTSGWVQVVQSGRAVLSAKGWHAGKSRRWLMSGAACGFRAHDGINAVTGQALQPSPPPVYLSLE